MVESMLVANSQQMYALNNLQKDSHELRKRLDRHHQEILKCRRELADLKATSLGAIEDQQDAYDVPYPSLLQRSLPKDHLLSESLRITRDKLLSLLQLL